jgi:hypothetical protein
MPILRGITGNRRGQTLRACWTGASLKDAGLLTFAAAKMGAEVIPGILDSIRKAMSERREYGKGKKAQNLRQLRRKLRTKDLV